MLKDVERMRVKRGFAIGFELMLKPFHRAHACIQQMLRNEAVKRFQ